MAWHEVAALSFIVIMYAGLSWLLSGRNWLIYSSLLAALAVWMAFWVTGLPREDPTSTMVVLFAPALVMFGAGTVWALTTQIALHWAKNWSGRRKTLGLIMQVVAMTLLVMPLGYVAVEVPRLMEKDPIWSAVCLMLVGVLFTSLIARPVRRLAAHWSGLEL